MRPINIFVGIVAVVNVWLITASLGFAQDGNFNEQLASYDPPPNRPTCSMPSCTADGWIDKEYNRSAGNECLLLGYYHELVKGKCFRYQCSNGYYYSFSGWEFWDCLDHGDWPPDPVCPYSSCLPS